MTYCKQCGTQLTENAEFCPACGARMPENAVSDTPATPVVTPAYAPSVPAYAPVGEEMDTAQYFLFLILVMIPVVGLILLLVWSLSKHTLPARRHLAQAYLLRRILVVLVGAILLVAGGLLVQRAAPSLWESYGYYDSQGDLSEEEMQEFYNYFYGENGGDLQDFYSYYYGDGAAQPGNASPAM